MYCANNCVFKTKKTNYDIDETLPSLPLPKLEDTLVRYFESLKPFGSKKELARSKSAIDLFGSGIGLELQKKLELHSSKKKNWLEKWWDVYAYHNNRIPLLPYVSMAMPLQLDVLSISEAPEHFLKNYARIIYHTLEFWELLRKGNLGPVTFNQSNVKFSSALYKRFFSTTRVPGLETDHIEKHFNTVWEGQTPTHGIIAGKGRIFSFECIHSNGSILSAAEILLVLEEVSEILQHENLGDSVAVLTNDNRTKWANNRKYLQELSTLNKKILYLVESSIIFAVIDENEPENYEETSQYAITGDMHSKWVDRSSIMVGYRNGKFAFIGEHSAYDGTISVSYAYFIQRSLIHSSKPQWNISQLRKVSTLLELKFDVDEKLKAEIARVRLDLVTIKMHVAVTHFCFDGYGKDLIKSWGLHPDSFLQVIIQLAYFQMHHKLASTYETALMRHYYNGRTETLRSCTDEVYKFLKVISKMNSTKKEIVNALKTAVKHHNHMMNEARTGKAIDRHLFGLWCTATENNMKTNGLYTDPLYNKSGGNGNFVLSTSTLGYTVNCGFVAPMIIDGYGIFYSIAPKAIYLQSTCYRTSKETSAHKINEAIRRTLLKTKCVIESVHNSKL